MGGIEIVPKATLCTRNRTITPQGALALIKLGILPLERVEAIHDKSKADVLAKFLVCVQGLWMLSQALGRKIEGLPLTLLELNTIMHVVCAILMYVLWFKKPQDVQTPLEFDADIEFGSPLNLTTALQAIENREIGEGSSDEYDKREHSFITWKEGLGYTYYDAQSRFTPGAKIWEVDSDNKNQLKPPTESPQDHLISQNPPTSETQTSGDQTRARDSIERRLDELQVHQSISDGAGTPHLEPKQSKTFKINEFRIYTNNQCWTLHFWSEITITKRGADFFSSFASTKRAQFWRAEVLDWDKFQKKIRACQNKMFCSQYASNGFELQGEIGSSMGLSKYATLIGWIATFILPALYGGVHLTPWNSHFPTYLERYLWRFSGLYIACGIPISFIFGWDWLVLIYVYVVKLFPALGYLLQILSKIFDAGNRIGHSLRGWNIPPHIVSLISVIVFCITLGLFVVVVITLLLIVMASLLCSLVLATLYPLARCYILIEAFASLRSLPRGAYQTVAWSEMWPHL